MEAKEYFENSGLQRIHSPDINGGRDWWVHEDNVAEFAEEYHQAKSKEEAEERYETAAKYWKNEVMNMFDEGEKLPEKFPRPFQVFKYGCIASGKEKS